MKRAWLVVGLVLLVGTLGVLGAVRDLQEASSDGELAFAKESVDLGRVPLGQPLIYRYQMRNVGNKPVSITKRDVAAVEGC